jgi:hypothetical protein
MLNKDEFLKIVPRPTSNIVVIVRKNIKNKLRKNYFYSLSKMF